MARQHSNDSDLTRRQFLRRSAGGLVGAVVGGAAASHGGCQPAAQPSPSESAPEGQGPTAGRATVIVIRDERALDGSPAARETVMRSMLDQALVRLTGAGDPTAGWETYARPGEKIAIKSNLNVRPVHPELLSAIHAGLTSVGVADKDVAAWEQNSAGFGREEFESLPQRPGFDEDDVSNLVTWADGLVNAAGLKAHWLAGIGCALKNWAGAVTNINVSDRNVTYAFHADSCAETGVLNAIPAIRERCRLIIIDALQPVFHLAPQVDPRYVWDYRGLIVGTDPVAVDTVCARIVQAKRDEYKGYEWPISPPAKHVQIADVKYGLGISAPERIDLVKLGWSEGALV